MCQAMPSGFFYPVPSLRREDIYLDKTIPADLKKWSSPIFQEKDQNVKFKSSFEQVDKIKLTASVLIGFVLIATLSSRQEVAYTNFVSFKMYVHLYLI